MSTVIITAQAEAREQTKKNLKLLKDQAAMSDQTILAAYCEAQRAHARAQIKMIEEGEASEQEIEDYVKKYGTDEG